MPLFTYRATDGQSTAEQRGTVTADTPRQARDLLRGRGLMVRDLSSTSVVEPKVVDPAAEPLIRKQRFLTSGRDRHHVTAFVRELSTLLNVGVPLPEALETLATLHRGRFRSVLLQLRERVTSGTGLAAAMREQPRVFDEFCHAITAVGEDAGTLDASLETLADFRERSDQLRGRIGTALVYPSIVLSMAVLAALFLMTFVVPRILEPLLEQGQELPLPTRIVKGASDFLLAWWWLLLSVVAVSVIALTAFLRTERGRRTRDTVLLRLPVFGPLARKQAVVRVAIVLSTLLRSGVVFVQALRIARRTVGNAVLADALGRCEQAVSAGGDIADALAKTQAFPATVVQVFAVGQQTGRLEDVLDRLARAYDQQVSSSSQRLAAILEPVLIIVLAVIVLFIILATVLPILEAGNAIG
ncbi:type II secretion system F family protein [Humisphaera borealis]|uniref:General secretion pathway protein F n=1 Tax=Humisphaera borealis TaxID=2807512 RepID=A0A7M2WZW9_9BACT|nr:type II secretion system F family protein [Humisphaera borealis]QOV90979.1 type II secretion system F family protein [Humisphaera borealis]